ncbi:GTPase Obg [bacterium HR36]|nr:GTPase Obg [bacterium HR36]
MFVDRVEIYVKGGDGGRGIVSFRREKYVPRGGPDGGDGGKGGDVIIRAVPGTDSLAAVAHQKHWRAEAGKPGGPNNRHGANGQDLIIPVPPGTLVRDRNRGYILRDLVNPGDEVIVARGGRGGRGNRAFATPTQQAPRFAEPGEPGEERWLILELKLIADVGLIGLPNAGKSTLLSRLSRAKPEIADYPFTTKYPNLGLVVVGEDRSFVMADVPGLIEGAHAGHGLGHEFLRHVERTRVLVHLVEPFPADGSDPTQNYHVIRRELQLHNPELLHRPEIIVLTKADLPDAEQVRRRLAEDLRQEVLAISAVTGQGLAQLIQRILAALEQQTDNVASPDWPCSAGPGSGSISVSGEPGAQRNP